jgi:hypothetical protein
MTLAASLAFCGPLVAADPCELPDPIISFIPVLIEHSDTLGLTEDQRALVAMSHTGMCASVRAVDAEIVQIRADLRRGIIEGSPVAERKAQAETIGALQARSLMLRSNCADHWRANLSPEQFSRMIALAASN